MAGRREKEIKKWRYKPMDGPRYFEHITEDIVKNGSIEIHSTKEDLEKISSVNLYNQYMKECRQKMKSLYLMRNSYLLMDCILTLLFMFAKYFPIMIEVQDGRVYLKLVIDIVIVIVHIALSFIFCIWKSELEFWPNVFNSAVLVFIDKKYGILFLLNTVICIVYRYKKGNLGSEPGYPLFYDIRIGRVRGKIYNTDKKEKVETSNENI